MSKKEKQSQKTEKQQVEENKDFVSDDAYPNCEGSPCDNVAEEKAEQTDNSAKSAQADKQPDKNIAAAAAETAEWKDKYMRLSAEFDNYRKRTLKEKMDLISAGGEDVIKSMLPVMDDFDRALAAISTAQDIEAVKAGVLLISQKMNDILKSKGVCEIESVGQSLDTDLHEAVAKFAAGEDKKGKIIDVVQKGYKLKDKVIRYAKVVVGE